MDASADHVGTAQRQSAAADWQPLAFFSKKLEQEQMSYSAFDRKLFACVASISHFRYMLEGHPFTIYTNHKPQTFTLGKVSEPWTAMQSRHLSMAEFTTDIPAHPGFRIHCGTRRPGSRRCSRESGYLELCQDSSKSEDMPGDF